MRTIEDAKRFHERAEECRSCADNMLSEDARHEMMKVAESYEYMAKRAERFQGQGND